MTKMLYYLKISKTLKIGILSSLLIASCYVCFNIWEGNSKEKVTFVCPPLSATTERGLIFIQSDAEFNEANGVISGEGTERAPYIIANWTIVGLNNRPSIEIRFTSVFFIIRNCIISNGDDGTGIRLSSLQNAVIANNTIWNSFVGISGEYIDNVNISNNHCYSAADTGIFMTDSEHLRISENVVYENQRWGIMFFRCNYSSIFGNYAHHNLWDGIRLEPGFFCVVQNNTCILNYQHGLILYYSEDNNLVGNNCSFNGRHGIALVFESQNNQVYENFLSTNGYGNLADETGRNDFFDNVEITGETPPEILSNTTEESSTSENSQVRNYRPVLWILVTILAVLVSIVIIVQKHKRGVSDNEHAFEVKPIIVEEKTKKKSKRKKTKKNRVYEFSKYKYETDEPRL